MDRIIAVDFDGTIVDHEFPDIGKLKPGAKKTLNKWHKDGISVIIWTCRNQVDPECGVNSTIFAVRKFLDANGIKYATINEHAPVMPFRLQSTKVFADMYIDDRNMGGFPGWDITVKAVKAFYKNGDWKDTYLVHNEHICVKDGN